MDWGWWYLRHTHTHSLRSLVLPVQTLLSVYCFLLPVFDAGLFIWFVDPLLPDLAFCLFDYNFGITFDALLAGD